MLWAAKMRPYLLKGHERPLNFLKWVQVMLPSFDCHKTPALLSAVLCCRFNREGDLLISCAKVTAVSPLHVHKNALCVLAGYKLFIAPAGPQAHPLVLRRWLQGWHLQRPQWRSVDLRLHL